MTKPARIAHAVLVAALLWAPAVLEGRPEQPARTAASDFATSSSRAEAASPTNATSGVRDVLSRLPEPPVGGRLGKLIGDLHRAVTANS